MKYGVSNLLLKDQRSRIIPQTAFTACTGCPGNNLMPADYETEFENWRKRVKLERKAIHANIQSPKGRKLKNYKEIETELRKKYPIYREILYCPLFTSSTSGVLSSTNNLSIFL